MGHERIDIKSDKFGLVSFIYIKVVIYVTRKNKKKRDRDIREIHFHTYS